MPPTVRLYTPNLMSWGCDSILALNGQEALALLQKAVEDKQPIGMAIIDFMMPEMDGFETTRAIRNSQAAYSKIPIIALTADAMKGDDERCFNAGMDDYIFKPVDPMLL